MITVIQTGKKQNRKKTVANVVDVYEDNCRPE